MNNVLPITVDAPEFSHSYMGVWPFTVDGLFPSHIYPPEHLYEVVFKMWPAYFNCPVATVRRAVRAHLKRYAPQSLKTLYRDQLEKDMALANAFASVGSSRIRAKELLFFRDDAVSKFGRPRKKSSVLEPGRSFGELIGHSYRVGEGLGPVFDWFFECAQPKSKKEKERYLSGPLLAEGVERGLGPVIVDSIEFARMVVIYAAFLKTYEEQALLVDTARSLGCTPLDGLYSVKLEADMTLSIEDANAERNIKQPKLLPGIAKPVSEWQPESNSLQAVAEFDLAISTWFKSKEQISELPFESLVEFISLADDKWKPLLAVMLDAREDAKHVEKCRLKIQEMEALLWGSIFKLVDLDQDWSRSGSELDENLVSEFLFACKINSALNDLNPSFYTLEIWRQSFNGAPRFSDFEALIYSVSVEAHNKLARQRFREEFNEYVRLIAPPALPRFLSGLNGSELGALIDGGDDCWLVGDAVVLRAALDRENLVPDSVMDVILSTASDRKRRTLLTFIDPRSSVVKTNLIFSRVVAVERFRDIFLFEPVAQILDPTSGLNDVELVGRNVFDIAELISINSSLLLTGADVSRLVRLDSNDNRASSALKIFACTPVTMQGNFRRLKEKAREKLLKAVMKNEEPNQKAAIALIECIESERFADELFFELQEERPDDQLEQRHREQLDRYLSQMDRLLKDFVSEMQHRPDVRLNGVASKLRKLFRQLRHSEKIGSLEWLEGQVAKIISNPTVGDNAPTLRGVAEGVLESRWDSRDTVWATDFIEFPEFYVESPLRTWDVAVASLYWQALGGPPSSLQIAQRLLEFEEHKGAIRFSKEQSDDEVRNYVFAAVSPQVAALNSQFDQLVSEYDTEVVCQFDEYKVFKAALAEYDFSTAGEHLELLELIVSDLGGSGASGVAHSAERRAKILKYFIKIGTPLEEPVPLDVQLEKLWLNAIHAHSSERVHLSVVEKALESIDNASDKLAKVIACFKEDNQNPERWLSPAISTDFSDFVRQPADTLAQWTKSAPMYIATEQRASYIVCEWFIGFVVERSKSIHQLDDVDSLSSAMDRIFEVSAIIVNATRPALCLAQLHETGELPDELIATVSESSDESTEVLGAAYGPHSHTVKQTGVFSTELVFEVSDLIKKELWAKAGELCEKINPADGEKVAGLYSLSDVFLALADLFDSTSSSVGDKLPAAAAWLSSSSEFTLLISESRKLDLAFGVLSGAVAADSGEPLTRVPAANGAWTEILGRTSPFRKMLMVGVTYRVEKVLETLLTGCLSIPVAERLWDAATNINDPHLYRTPLLTFLYEHGASEALARLAGKYDPGIAARLSQLFELRLVASNRSDLIPVAQSVADQVVTNAKSLPFRTFVKLLPTAAQVVKPNLFVECEDELCLRDPSKGAVFELPIIVTPQGLVPAKLEAVLFEGDDALFEDDTLKSELSNRPLYFAGEFTLRIRFGSSWFAKGSNLRDSVRIRVRAKTVTDELFVEDVICRVRAIDSRIYNGANLNTDTLLDIYPGVSNTPAIEEAFIGRHDELECLNQVLVSARRPSPVLLTGMRRIGKTSLLFAFHKRLRQPGSSTAVSFYISLAERRVEFVGHDRSVSATIFRAISHGLVRPNLSSTDQNYALCMRIRQRFDGDWRAARKAIQECFDDESLSDSLIALSEKILEWSGAPSERFILLIDEAESLVAPYQAGGKKKLELEQLLQSLREISQTTGAIGILLSGSNHINIFAREYKNAFFGSSQLIELAGLKDAKEAAALIAPPRVKTFVQFDVPAIEYAFLLCAGMPQFLWQVGATVAHLVRSGVATKRDVRMAVAALVGEKKAELPFKSYEILEPIDSMLALESARERDLLWMLLYRIANASSLVAEDATVPFVIDHALSALEERSAWNRRLRSLVDLKILRMDSSSTIRFQVPLFAEGFRAKKYWQEYNVRLQGVAI